MAGCPPRLQAPDPKCHRTLLSAGAIKFTFFKHLSPRWCSASQHTLAKCSPSDNFIPTTALPVPSSHFHLRTRRLRFRLGEQGDQSCSASPYTPSCALLSGEGASGAQTQWTCDSGPGSAWKGGQPSVRTPSRMFHHLQKVQEATCAILQGWPL